MTASRRFGRLNFAWALAIFGALLLFAPQAVLAAKFYVDGSTLELKPGEKAAPVTPRPLQILYEFQRDGGPNPKATKFTKGWILEDLKASGGFSEVAETPVAGGAVLSIKFNNVVDPEKLKKAKADGFKTGLSFGLFGGTVVEDLYEVTFEYVPSPGAAPIKTVVFHKLTTTIGKVDQSTIPGVQYKKGDLAVRELVRQVMVRGLNNLFVDPAFPR